MNENLEAKAQELDPTRTRTIGSYVIGTPPSYLRKDIGKGHLRKSQVCHPHPNWRKSSHKDPGKRENHRCC